MVGSLMGRGIASRADWYENGNNLKGLEMGKLLPFLSVLDAQKDYLERRTRRAAPNEEETGMGVGGIPQEKVWRYADCSKRFLQLWSRAACEFWDRHLLDRLQTVR